MIKFPSLRSFSLACLIAISGVSASASLMAATVLMPTPREGFDPTEVAVPWKALTAAGHTVIFTTPDGQPGNADHIMLTGEGLGLLKGLLANDSNGVRAYKEMVASFEYQNPIPWNALKFEDYDALALGGGHDKGVREYLESDILQLLISRFIAEDRPIAAICHGVLLAARSKGEDGRSVLFDRNITALLKSQELLAWKMTKIWMGTYYRTYDVTVEDEIKSLIRSNTQFQYGPFPFSRDTPEDFSAGFVVRDDNLLTARWPGDAHLFAASFVEMLEEYGL